MKTRRDVPGDAVLLKCLVALVRAIDSPPLRLRRFLAVMQRLFNIDGYAVLTYDHASDTIALNRALLFAQFEM